VGVGVCGCVERKGQDRKRGGGESIMGCITRDLQKRPTKETYKRDLQKRPTKETYKRDSVAADRPVLWDGSQETYKRDLGKRPTEETSKETA